MKKKTMKLIGFMFVLGVVIGLIHIFHGLTLDRVRDYRRIEVTAPHFPRQEDGYTVAFVTDTHLLPSEELYKVVERLNAMELDTLLLGGDFTTRNNTYLRHLNMLTKNVRTKDGIFLVRGNHDHAMDLQGIADEFENLEFLDNTGQFVREGLFIGGVQDYWYGEVDFATARAGAGQDDYVIVLSHNPDATKTSDMTGIDLVLSGHTHGGQVTLFGLYAPYLDFSRITSYGQLFKGGFVRVQDTLVYTSRGTGSYMPRVFARPEVTIMQFYNGPISGYNIRPDYATVLFWVYMSFNVVVFVVFARDKIKAMKKRYRISERVLLSLMVLAPFGGVLGVYGIRHKIRKVQFSIGVICVMLVYLGVGYYVFWM